MLSPSCPLKSLNEKSRGSHLILTKCMHRCDLRPVNKCPLNSFLEPFVEWVQLRMN